MKEFLTEREMFASLVLPASAWIRHWWLTKLPFSFFLTSQSFKESSQSVSHLLPLIAVVFTITVWMTHWRKSTDEHDRSQACVTRGNQALFNWSWNWYAELKGLFTRTVISPSRSVSKFNIVSMIMETDRRKERVVYSLEFSLNVFTELSEFSDKTIFHNSKSTWTCHLLCKRTGCYHRASKTHVRDRIFKFMPQWFIRFSEFAVFTEFKENSPLFRKNSIVYVEVLIIMIISKQ